MLGTNLAMDQHPICRRGGRGVGGREDGLEYFWSPHDTELEIRPDKGPLYGALTGCSLTYDGAHSGQMSAHA